MKFNSITFKSLKIYNIHLMDQVLSAIIEIKDTIKTYSVLLEKTGFSGANPEIYEFIQSTVDAFDELKTEPGKSVESLFETFYDITRAIYDLELIRKIFDMNRITESRIGTMSSSITISSKYVSDLSSLLDAVFSQIDHMKIKFQNLQIEIVFADKINTPTLEEIPKFVNHVSDIYKKYVQNSDGIHVIDLYFEVLQRMYRASVDKPGSKEIVQSISNTIYDIKQQLLTTDFYNTSVVSLNKKNMVCNAIQSMIQTFKLIPNEPASLQDQFPDVKISSDIVKSLTTASKLLGIGFILIKKVSSNPIRHDIDRIIYPKKVLPSIAGVCQAVIERAETLQPLKAAKLDLDPITIIGDFDKNYILQTLDGVKWSRLTPWKDDVPIQITLDPSEKLGMYNSILNEKILQNIHKPFVDNQIDMQMEIKREDAYWNAVRQKVKQSILARYKSNLEGYKVVRSSTIRSMMTDSKEIQQQMNYIGQLAIDEFGLDKIKINDQPKYLVEQFRSEIAIAFLRETKSIEKRYLTTLNDMLDDHQTKIDRATTAKEQEISLANINRIVSTLEPIVEEHLKIFINRKSSIFITIQNIIDILHKTLL
jgi:DNA-binding protein Fis